MLNWTNIMTTYTGQIDSIEWLTILIKCGVDSDTAGQWADAFASVVNPTTFSAGYKELDDFLGQILHESCFLKRLEENLNYSAKRLTQVWPKRFPTENDARPYANSPEALANNVYGNRLGNTNLGDGWRYRGGGLIMVTGKANYMAIEALTGIPFVASPELLRTPGPDCLRATIAWWEHGVKDSSIDDVEAVSEEVNGGHIGLEDRKELTLLATNALATVLA